MTVLAVYDTSNSSSKKSPTHFSTVWWLQHPSWNSVLGTGFNWQIVLLKLKWVAILAGNCWMTGCCHKHCMSTLVQTCMPSIVLSIMRAVWNGILEWLHGWFAHAFSDSVNPMDPGLIITICYIHRLLLAHWVCMAEKWLLLGMAMIHQSTPCHCLHTPSQQVRKEGRGRGGDRREGGKEVSTWCPHNNLI